MKLNTKDDKMYIFKFMFNGNQNKAADPRPFKLSNLEAHAKKAIGRPFVVAKWGEKYHVRPEEDSSAAMIEHQKKYSIGEIVNYMKSETSDNYYAIIDVWPKFQGMIESDLIPEFTSPTFFVNSENQDGIQDADFLNLHAVPHPGYEPEFAKISGMCQGGLDQCMSEMKTLAAAGSQSQDSQSISQGSTKFSLTNSKNKDTMSTEPKTEPTNSDLMTAMTTIQTEVKTIGEKQSQIITAVGDIATQAEGVDSASIAKTLGVEASKDDETETPEEKTVGAAGGKLNTTPESNQSESAIIQAAEIKKLQKELEGVKTLYQTRENEIDAEKRKTQASQIVNRLIELKQIPLDKKEEKIKHYIELKNNDELADLTILHKTLTQEIKVIGAAGLGGLGYELPALNGDGSGNSTALNNLDMMKSLGGRV